MPPVVATQEIASRSQQSSVKAIRTFSPLSQPISNPSEHQRVSGRSTATRPSCRRSWPFPGMAFEQQSVRFHDPVNPLHVHRRIALLAVLAPQ